LAFIGVDLTHFDQLSSQAENRHCSDRQRTESQQWSRDINAVARDLAELYQLGVQLIDLELELPRNEYRRLMPRRIASAAVPYVEIREMPTTDVKGKGLLGALYDALFRYLSHRILRPLNETFAAVLENGDARILQIGAASGVPASTLNGIRGLHVRLST